MTRLMQPRLAIALGDPAGIGPEVILRALADPTIQQNCDLTVMGSRQVLQETYERLHSQKQPSADPDYLKIYDIPLIEPMRCGVESATTGAASFTYLSTAIAQTLAGEFAGIVTAPIAKSAWKAAGYHYPGQTELLAEKAGVSQFGMLFVAQSPHTGWMLRVLLATTHIPLREVPTVLTPTLLSAKLDLLVDCLRRDFGVETPQIAIAGLNPHSGEQGQLGREEQDWLIPWIQQVQRDRPDLSLRGPIPPDTLWVNPAKAWYNPECLGDYDGYLALYHDQGLIPVKMLAFDRAVNTSIGLPFIRTSPDHGTAFDIAGKNVADATSMKAAIQLAAELAYRKSVNI